jgi:DNA (cytosine-5)-methyltransferase 1
MSKQGKSYKTIDLFAGIGGIRIGFEREGFKTVFANDNDDYCKVTYDGYFKNVPLTVEDIRKINIEDLPEFDVLLGGFPCQAFSIAGYRQGFEDTRGRGDLFFYVAKILEQRKPKAFLLENVKNLVSHDNKKTFKIILETLDSLGYKVKYDILNTYEYGNLPQNRERTYIVGFLDEKLTEKFRFPTKRKLSTAVKELLEANPDEKYYYNGKPLYERIKDDIISEDSVYQWRRQYVRENKKNLCPTLTANMGTGGHNVPIVKVKDGIRKLTPRECLRLQGFPEDYPLPDLADSRIYKQAGNSVSIPVIQRIAKSMMEALNS